MSSPQWRRACVPVHGRVVGTALRNFKKAFDGAEDEWKKIHTLPGPAAADGEETGFVKVHVKERTDRILGATIVASHAGEMINEITLAMVAGIGLRTLARVIHAYPTQAEAIRKAADAYNRTRLTPTIQSLLRRWLAW